MKKFLYIAVLTAGVASFPVWLILTTFDLIPFNVHIMFGTMLFCGLTCLFTKAVLIDSDNSPQPSSSSTSSSSPPFYDEPVRPVKAVKPKKPAKPRKPRKPKVKPDETSKIAQEIANEIENESGNL